MHGVLLCQAEVGGCRPRLCRILPLSAPYAGVDPGFLAARPDAWRDASRHQQGLGLGTRGRGSEATAAPIWGISAEEYLERCDPWPLNPKAS